MRYSILILILTSLLTSCGVDQPAQSHVQDAIISALNNAIHDNKALTKKKKRRYYRRASRSVPVSSMKPSLIPDISVKMPESRVPAEHRFDVHAVDIPAQQFFLSLVKDTPYSIVVDPSLKRNISLSLKNVTVNQAIDIAANTFGFQYEETSYGYKIEPKKMITRILNVNYLDVNRKGTSRMRVSHSTITDVIGTAGAASSPGTSTSEASDVKTTINNDFWKELKENTEQLIGNKDGRQVIVNPDSGVVIVHAYPSEIRMISKYFKHVQKNMNRQVILEAKILEVKLDADYQTGIKWRYIGLNLDGTQAMTGQLADPNSLFQVENNISTEFTSIINLLNTQGRTEVLSSPRVATMNNQKAIIKVGEDEFFITNVSSTTSGSSSDTVTQNVDFTPFFSGIALDVIPEIDKYNNVTLHIHPIISTVEIDNKNFTLSGQTTSNLPLAKSTIRESDTVVHAKSGQVIVLGGLMENETKSFDGSIPGVDATRLKNLFGRHDKKADKLELVILLRAIVVKNHAWNDELKSARNRFENMRKPFRYTVHQIIGPKSQHTIEKHS